MIISNGIDIIDISRIKKTIEKYNFKFKKKCFHSGEISKSESRFKSVESYAKRYHRQTIPKPEPSKKSNRKLLDSNKN